jgi:hypothetical protein
MLSLHRLLFLTASALAFSPSPSRRLNFYLYANKPDGSGNQKWEKLSQFVSIDTPWMRLIGERLLDDRKNELEYWRVQKDDSLVVVTKHRDRFVLPTKMYRPGLDEMTLDFPGGRVPSDTSNMDGLARKIVCRELCISGNCIESMEALNKEQGWPINSSFSNQKLFGYVCVLVDETELDENNFVAYTEVEALLDELPCLQCRHVLLEYLRSP